MADRQGRFKAVTVGRRGLELIRPLVERFVETGAGEWDTETLLRVAWDRLGTPLFRVWAVVREGSNEPLGFAAAQVQAGNSGPEVFVIAAYVQPGLPPGVGIGVLWEATRRWGRVMGCSRAAMRTHRGDEEGPTEPRAWARLGFVYESTILACELQAELGRRVQSQSEVVPADGAEEKSDG